MSALSTTSTAGNANQKADVLSLVLSLPPRFYGICPHSLCASSEGRCKIKGCRLQQVCEAFNDEKGDGCKDEACRFLHEHRSCHEEIDGFGCRFMGVDKNCNSRIQHLKKRAHSEFVLPEEWNARIAVAGLRVGHQEGKY